MKDLRRFIKTTIREFIQDKFINESNSDNELLSQFTNTEIKELIDKILSDSDLLKYKRKIKNMKHIKLFEQFILNEDFYEYTKEIGDIIKSKFDLKKTHTDNFTMIVSKNKNDNTIIGHIASSLIKDDSKNYPISKKNPLYGKSIIWGDNKELNKILVDSGTKLSKGYNS